MNRGKIHVPDAIMASVVTIALLATAPVYYDLIDILAGESGPLGTLLLQLIIPFMLISILISAGVSAKRRE